MKSGFFRKFVYYATLVMITLSGFAQMPIFKRYYIADIPGLGWLAKFYVTHQIHYITAVILIAFSFYMLTGYILKRSAGVRLTAVAKLKIFSIAGLIATGGILAYKNLPGVYMGHGLISILDIVHLGFCMLLLMTGFYSLVAKKKWVKQTTRY